jgi:hypothetical protein
MKKLALAVAAAAALATATPAHAEEKLLGTITNLAVQETAAVATLKDVKTGQTLDVAVADKITLDKFKDKRIVVGDEIKCKYEKQDGKNVATYFKKAAGC